MNPRQHFAIIFLFMIGCVAVSPATADGPTQDPTIVTVKKLCPTCGKRILEKLSELPQVKAATMDLKERTFRVRCEPGSEVSPRAVWETIERGGEQPVRLDGPAGTFTTKPQR